MTVTQQSLTEKVRRYLDLVPVSISDKRRQSELRQISQELYRLLIEPIFASLDREKTLCIVPDKTLHYLPFQALVSPGDQYLIEQFALMYAASASAFIACTLDARNKSGARTERLLVVGNPAFDRAIFPQLQILPAAAREAQQISGFYSAPRALIGHEAEEQAVRREIAIADVAHLATHYLVDEYSALASRLVMAKSKTTTGASTEADGALQNFEIYQMKLPRARLVVLSACQTGVERSLGGEGALGAARPFIAAGAPLVVASLWPVDSQATADLMIEFHRQRRQLQKPTVMALRQAQLSLLNEQGERRGHPYYWASFSLFGGYAEF